MKMKVEKAEQLNDCLFNYPVDVREMLYLKKK